MIKASTRKDNTNNHQGKKMPINSFISCIFVARRVSIILTSSFVLNTSTQNKARRSYNPTTRMHILFNAAPTRFIIENSTDIAHADTYTIANVMIVTIQLTSTRLEAIGLIDIITMIQYIKKGSRANESFNLDVMLLNDIIQKIKRDMPRTSFTLYMACPPLSVHRISKNMMNNYVLRSISQAVIELKEM